MVVCYPGVHHHGKFPDLEAIGQDDIPIIISFWRGDFPDLDLVIDRLEQNVRMGCTVLQLLLTGQPVFPIDFHPFQAAQTAIIIIIMEVLYGNELNMFLRSKKGCHVSPSWKLCLFGSCGRMQSSILLILSYFRNF